MKFILSLIPQVKYPAASYGASNLQRSRAAGYLTLAAFAKYPCKHGYLAHCFAGIKDGQYRSVSYKGNERKELYLPLDSDEITRYYQIFIQVGLTGTENGQEEDYMSLDLVAEIASPDDKIDLGSRQKQEKAARIRADFECF